MSLSTYILKSCLSQFFVLTLSIELVLSPPFYFFPLLFSVSTGNKEKGDEKTSSIDKVNTKNWDRQDLRM